MRIVKEKVKERIYEKNLKDLFRQTFGRRAEMLKKLKGDGSARQIYRMVSGKITVVGVYGPDKLENRAFLEFSKHFRKLNLPIPEIYAENRDKQIYLEEDLGDVTLFDYLTIARKDSGFPKKAEKMYKKAISYLPQFQLRAMKGFNLNYCYPRRSFDRQSILWDLNYFKYYFLKLANIPFNEQKLESDFNVFADFLLQADREYLLYRDFQSRNIMIKNSSPRFIDFQGARGGALQYDIASLLYDAKADIPYKVRKELLDFYLRQLSKYIPVNVKKFMDFYPAYVYIRIMQAMGAYGLRGFYEGKTHFLESVPYAVKNIEYLLTHSREFPVRVPHLMRVFRNIVDSSRLRQLGKAKLGLTVRIQSFSYRSGIPSDERGHGGGFVFDCRALPNPGKFAAYASLSGKDAQVAEFLERRKEVGDFLRHVFELIRRTAENYLKRNFSDLMVSFGCTGGRHRSVYCAEKLGQYLGKMKNVNVEIRHLGMEPPP